MGHNTRNQGLSLERELQTAIASPPFGHIDVAGLQSARGGTIAGTRAAETAPLNMRLAHLVSMGTANIDPFEDIPETSRETDIADLFAVVAAFRVRHARRSEDNQQPGEQAV